MRFQACLPGHSLPWGTTQSFRAFPLLSTYNFNPTPICFYWRGMCVWSELPLTGVNWGELPLAASSTFQTPPPASLWGLISVFKADGMTSQYTHLFISSTPWRCIKKNDKSAHWKQQNRLEDALEIMGARNAN